MSYSGKQFPKSRWDDRYTIDPDVDFIRLDLSSGGDPSRMDALRAALRADADAGHCNILFMDGSLAIVQWVDREFILSITPKGRELAFPLPGGDA